MDVSGYLSELYGYVKPELGDADRSFLVNLINARDRAHGFFPFLKSNTLSNSNGDSYLKARMLKLNLAEEIVEEGLFRTRRELGLNTYGLFYLLSNMASYPQSILIRYQNNVVLQTLLYRYFETSTINNGTDQFHSLIVDYLRKCCEVTLNFIRTIPNLSKGCDNDSSQKQHEEELVWSAKVLAFKIGLLYNCSISPGDLYERSRGIESATTQFAAGTDKNALAVDRKFLGLLSIVRSDIEEAYSELVHSKELHLTHL
jgi:hypothetical protein